jgi:hypothetical protein
MPIFTDRSVTRGTTLEIQGFGTHENSAYDQSFRDAGKVGISVVQLISSGLIRGDYFGGSASVCPGDSGGPAILEDSGYKGIVGIATAGRNQVVNRNCVRVGNGDFFHVYLQSGSSLSFLKRFPNIRFISGLNIFVQSASNSALPTLKKALRTPSTSATRTAVGDALSIVSKALSYARGDRSNLLRQATSDLTKARRESSL